MTLRPRRVVRPVAGLPRAVPIVQPKDMVAPTLREFYEQYCAENLVAPALFVNGRPQQTLPELPRPPRRSTSVFVPSWNLNRPGYKSVLCDTLGPSYWPKTFDMRYDNFIAPYERTDNGTDYEISRAIHDPAVEYAFVQSVTIDPRTHEAGVRISDAIHVSERFRKAICNQNVRHKIYALASIVGRMQFYPISLPNVRLVWLLGAYYTKYGKYPEIVNKRVNEYEKSKAS